MRRLLALALALLFAHPATASVVRVPVAIAPSGSVAGALRAQTQALLSSPAALPEAFRAILLPSPVAATPEAYAARAALVEALAAPKAALPALAAALRESGGKKAEKAASALEELGGVIKAAPAAERQGLAAEASALRARFDGASAAPGEAVDLAGLPTREGGGDAKAARRDMKADRRRIKQLQEALAASKNRPVLIVLQGMDTAGKDGVIKRPLALNPAWTKVSSFKQPTAEEASHDFLWRVKNQLPGKGVIGIFNRSHYEDIVVPAVYGSFSKAEVESRYGRIAAFERKLVERGVVIVKIFLNVSKDEQKARLQARLDDPEKRWKFSPADLETRKRWDAFHRAYAEVLARTSTPWAPWRIVAADDKPGRDAKVARIVRKTLARLGLRYPQAPDTDGVTIPD